MQLKIIKNLLSKIECEDIAHAFMDHKLIDEPVKGIKGNSQGIYNLDYVSMIHDSLTPLVSKEFGKNLVTTYCYTRKYKKHSLLVQHRDRPACEYSLTLHIKSSNPDVTWPIYFEIDGERKNLILEQGDCCLYKGMEIRHGRDKCPVNWYIQVFMHWVDLNGEYKEHAYDSALKKLMRINDNT